MIGFGLGGIFCGRWADKFGISRVIQIGALGVVSGYVIAAVTSNIYVFGIAHGLLIGFLGVGSSFVPLIADTSLWWAKRRGIAVAICASGNYLAGTVWPPIIQYGVQQMGWRDTYMWLGIFTAVVMVVLSFKLLQRPPLVHATTTVVTSGHTSDTPFGLLPKHAQLALFIAAVGCCVAMSMPQVHIVAYCTDLGFGAARGAEMLSLMLGFGIVSRLASGWISDHIGGLKTLLVGSALQCLALVLFLPFDDMASLYVISALFGLFQGGIVPSYAIIIREYFSPKEAGARVGSVILGTLIGMAFGGWISGAIFDLTGRYQAAFINGIAWNAMNFMVILWLLKRSSRIVHSKHI
jgi:MFS family permease